jgi:hypothetical protein
VEISCSCVAQIEMEIKGGTEEFNVTSVFKPRQVLQYSVLLNWTPSTPGLFNIQCKLRNGKIVQAWSYQVVGMFIKMPKNLN